MIDTWTAVSLLDRVREHDPEACARLAALLGPLLSSWWVAWGVDGPAAHDLGQQVLQDVVADLDTLRRDDPDQSFLAWVQGLARRWALKGSRPHDARPAADGVTCRLRRLAVGVMAPAPLVSAVDVKQLHHRALELIRGEFDDQAWRAFWACGVEGRPPADVGRDLGLTPVAVRKARSRVLRRLKEEFGEILG